jgi:hypothetical protein
MGLCLLFNRLGSFDIGIYLGFGACYLEFFSSLATAIRDFKISCAGA